MSTKTHRCLTVVCDQCGTVFKGYEDEYTVHFDKLDEFDAWMKDMENPWVTEGDKHYCGECACENEGHPREEGTLRLQRGLVQFCRCGLTWPVDPGRATKEENTDHD